MSQMGLCCLAEQPRWVFMGDYGDYWRDGHWHSYSCSIGPLGQRFTVDGRLVRNKKQIAQLRGMFGITA
jgi:hypothetical protein